MFPEVWGRETIPPPHGHQVSATVELVGRLMATTADTTADAPDAAAETTAFERRLAVEAATARPDVMPRVAAAANDVAEAFFTTALPEI
jgi:hypothetical protein